MDWLLPTLAILCLPIAALWLWRRRRITRGLRCWNCDADLRDTRLHVDFRGQTRCPKCGNEMDVTDTYKLPSE